MKKICLFTVIVLLSACAQYSMVKSGPQTMGPMTVTPSHDWNQVPSTASLGSLPTWTADGITLDTVTFFADVEDGKPLIKPSRKDETYPVFQANMLPTELVDVFESTLAKAYNAKITQSGQLKPVILDGKPGFEYTFEFVTPDELTRRGYIAGMVKDGHLHMIFYQAAKLYYFEHQLENVRMMVSSMSVK